jgi:hypothetical protein
LNIKKRIYSEKQGMPQILQWMTTHGESGMTEKGEGFGLNPTSVKVVGSDRFQAVLLERINAFKDGANKSRAAGGKGIWCDSSVIEEMADNASLTEHMIVVADTDRMPETTGDQVTGTIRGLLTMGRDTVHGDPANVLTIFGACANTPENLNKLLQALRGGDRLKFYGVKQVKTTIFNEELLAYSLNGFLRVVDNGATSDVVLNVSPSGGKRRKSKTVRTKRKRMTRKNRSKQ